MLIFGFRSQTQKLELAKLKGYHSLSSFLEEGGGLYTKIFVLLYSYRAKFGVYYKPLKFTK